MKTPNIDDITNERQSLTNTASLNYGAMHSRREDRVTNIINLQEQQNNISQPLEENERDLSQTELQINSISAADDNVLSNLITEEINTIDTSVTAAYSMRMQLMRIINRHNLFQDAITSFVTRSPVLLATVPLKESRHINNAKIIEAVFDGIRLHFKWLWPAIFTGMNIHDVTCYLSQPENRYGNTLRDLFLGLSTNQLSWSTRLGADIPDTALYWLAPMTIVLAPTLTIAINLIIRNGFWNTSDIENIEKTIKEDSAYIRRLISVLPNNGFSEAEFAILWEGRIAQQKRVEFVEHIIKAVENSCFPVQLRALNILAKIVDCFEYNAIQKIKSSGIDITHLAELQRKALKILELSSRSSSNNFFCYSYANYLLWTLGKKPLLSVTQLYNLTWLYTPYMLYANARLIEIFVHKIKDIVEFSRKQTACNMQRKTWGYQIELGNYACTVCGDWDDIPLAEIYTGQDCLDALLRLPLSPKQLLAKLPRLLSQHDIDSIDLSRHVWVNWEYAEWDTFLNQFEIANLTNFASLNLSQIIAVPIPPEANKIIRLNEFFKKIKVKNISLNQLGLGADNIKLLAPAFTNPAPICLELAANGLEDEGAEYLIPFLPNATENLILSSNRLGQIAVEQIGQYLSYSNLRELDISRNILAEEGVIKLMSYSQRSSLQILDLSFSRLTKLAVEAIGKALITAKIKELKLAHTSLDDLKIKVLASYIQQAQELQILDISSNDITNQGIAFLFPALRNSTVHNLSLANNRLTDNGLAISQKYIIDTSLVTIDISKNHFSNRAFRQFVARLNETMIENLFAGENNFNDEIIPGFINLFSSKNYKLKQIALTSNRLTSTGIRPFLLAANNTCLAELDLANNHINSDIADVLPDFIIHSSIEVLNLSNNQFNATIANAFAKMLPNSQLKKLLLAKNPLSAEGTNAIAAALIKPLPNMADYANPAINLDEARAIAKSQASSQLTTLDLSNTELNEQGARIFCRVQPYTNISFEALKLNHNPPIENFNTSVCRRLTQDAGNQPLLPRNRYNPLSNSAYSLLSLTIPFIQVLILFYILFRLLNFLTKKISGNRFQFFNNHADKRFSLDADKSLSQSTHLNNTTL